MARDLAKEPCWQESDLGHPLPDEEHAVSVAMPLWQHVVGYEEGDEKITSQFKAGYPRFFYHPLTAKLFSEVEERFAGEGEFAIVFPSKKVALEANAFVQKQTAQNGRLESYGILTALILSDEARGVAKDFWQHQGQIVSSRQAQFILTGGGELKDASSSKKEIRERIAQLVGAGEEDVFLFSSGMAAIYFAYKFFNWLVVEAQTVQFGFPYVDTLKIQEKFGRGVSFFSKGDNEDLSLLAKLLGSDKVSGVVAEFPSNPLLKSIDLEQLYNLLSEKEVPLLIDDTIGTFFNVDLLEKVDFLASSLTKFFSGEGNVLAGSLVVNKNSEFYQRFIEFADREYEDLLWSEDAILLEEQSRDFTKRVQQINQTAEKLCDFLKEHPAVESIYYPKYTDSENYSSFKRKAAGYGGLFSIVLKEAAKKAPAFYDKLRISKGPNLGTNFTLACPFTLLAHYNELDWAEECGISRYLVRVSVGLESSDDLIQRFTEALES